MKTYVKVPALDILGRPKEIRCLQQARELGDRDHRDGFLPPTFDHADLAIIDHAFEQSGEVRSSSPVVVSIGIELLR